MLLDTPPDLDITSKSENYKGFNSDNLCILIPWMSFRKVDLGNDLVNRSAKLSWERDLLDFNVLMLLLLV